jgi:hypothetical protein
VWSSENKLPRRLCEQVGRSGKDYDDVDREGSNRLSTAERCEVALSPYVNITSVELQGQDFPAGLPAPVKTTYESASFYIKLILGYFSFGKRIGSCESHRRESDVQTAVYRRAKHIRIFLSIARGPHVIRTYPQTDRKRSLKSW